MTKICIAALVTLFVAGGISAQENSRPTGMKLEWTHFIGGRGEDGPGWLRAPVLDRDGMLWFTGVTQSRDFPVTPDALDTNYHGGSRQWGKEDVFLVKFNTRQPGIAYATFLGGTNGPEHASDLIVDAAGNVTIVGNTGSADFPTTADALTKQFQGPDFRHADGFLTVLGDGGRKLKYSTFIGGGKNDWVDKLFIDASGEMTLFGITESANFPAADTIRPKGLKAASALFALRLDARGQKVLASRILANSWGFDVQRLDSGDFLVVGSTDNPEFQATTDKAKYHGGSGSGPTGGDVFVIKLSADLKTISFATLFGGAGDESYPKVATVPGGDFFVCGQTTSKDLPVTAGAVEKSLNDKEAVFLTRFSGDGQQLKYCTYLGGGGTNSASGVGQLVCDGQSKVYLTGATTSPRYPVTSDALQPTHRGRYDAFLLAFNIADNSLAYGSYLGGAKSEWSPFLAFDGKGAVYAIGPTDSNDFPTHEKVPAQRRRMDVFITKFLVGLPPAGTTAAQTTK